MPGIIPFRERQLLNGGIGLLGIGGRSRHAGAVQDLRDMTILAEHDACDALGEHVLVLDSPCPAVAEFAMIYRNERQGHGRDCDIITIDEPFGCNRAGSRFNAARSKHGTKTSGIFFVGPSRAKYDLFDVAPPHHFAPVTRHYQGNNEGATIDRFGFDVELLYVAYRAGLRLSEIPVRWDHAEGSKISFATDSYRMLSEVGRIRQQARRGVYDNAIKAARAAAL